MQKIKKYIYPPIFSALFIAFDLTTVSIINAIPTDGYGGLGLGLMILFSWILVLIPIYCVRYSKLIIDEKFNYLFALYNTLVIIVGHLFLFMAVGVQVMVFFSLWVVLCNVIPLVLRIFSRKKAQNPNAPKDASGFLLQNKNKNIIAIVIVCLYIIGLINGGMFASDALQLVSAVIVAVFLFSKSKDYILKPYMLSIALAGEILYSAFHLFSVFASIDSTIKIIPTYPVSVAFDCALLLLLVAMFIGTLFNFRYINLVKYGALGRIVLLVIRLGLQLFEIGGKANAFVIAIVLLRALYFSVFFILATNKRDFDKI